MRYFQVRYDSTVVNYDRRGFIGLATGSVFLYSFQILKIGRPIRQFLYNIDNGRQCVARHQKAFMRLATGMEHFRRRR